MLEENEILIPRLPFVAGNLFQWNDAIKRVKACVKHEQAFLPFLNGTSSGFERIWKAREKIFLHSK